MAVAAAALALLFHVADLAAGRHFAIASHHASTAKCREPQESNETHRDLHSRAEQYVCRAFGANVYAPLLSRCVYRLQRRRARERTRSDLWTEKPPAWIRRRTRRARCDASRVLATTVGHVTYGRVSVFSLSRERGVRAGSRCGDRQRAADDSCSRARPESQKNAGARFLGRRHRSSVVPSR